MRSRTLHGIVSILPSFDDEEWDTDLEKIKHDIEWVRDRLIVEAQKLDRENES